VWLALSRRRADAHRFHVHLGEGLCFVAGAQAVGAVAGEQLAVTDQRDLVAELLGLLEVVRGEQDRRPVFVQLADVAPELNSQLEVDARGRLVEDHEPRSVHQRTRQLQAPFLAARQPRGPHVGLRFEVEGADHLFRALLGLGLRHAEVAAVVDERFAHREEAVEVDVLLGEPHPGART